MPIPPWEQVWAMLRPLLPALATAIEVMLVLRLLGGARLAPVAAALAVAAGVVVGNHIRPDVLLSWRLDADRPLTATDLTTVLGWSLEGKPPPRTAEDGTPIPIPEDLPRPVVPFYWLPWLAGLAFVVELLARLPGVPVSVGWAARALVAVLAGRLFTPPVLRVELPWLPWALAAAMLLNWALLTDLARRWRDSTVPAALVLCYGVAGVVLLHAHALRLTEVALLWAAALGGPAAVAWKWTGDTGPAAAGAVVFLPGLLLTGHQLDLQANLGLPFERASEVPWQCFALVGLAPLALAPLALPVLNRQEGWRRWVPAFALVLAPLVAAVAVAAQVESVEFPTEEKDEWAFRGACTGWCAVRERPSSPARDPGR